MTIPSTSPFIITLCCHAARIQTNYLDFPLHFYHHLHLNSYVLQMKLSYVLSIYLSCLSLVGCPPAKSIETKVDLEQVEDNPEIAVLKEDIEELTEEVEEIKEDVEVLQLKEDMREIKEDVAEIKEDVEDLKRDEEGENDKHNHVNPYKFFNKKKSEAKNEKLEKKEDTIDQINPLRLRRILNFCASEEITEGFTESCSSLMKLVMSLSELIENVDVKEDSSTVDENEINRDKLRRSKRFA